MRAFLILLLCVAPLLAEVKVEPGPYKEGQLVRVTYDPGVPGPPGSPPIKVGDRVGVIAKGENSVDQYDDKNGTLVFTGLDGTYTVIGFGAGGEFIARDVKIVGATPPPNPPGPDPPSPNPPSPIDIQDTWGVGKFCYQHAVATGDKAGAAALAKVWYDAANMMFMNRADIQTATKFIETESNARLGANASKWIPWARAMEGKFRELKLPESILDHVRAYQEVSKALMAASK